MRPLVSVGFGAEPPHNYVENPLIKRKIVNYTWVPKSITVIAETNGILLKTAVTAQTNNRGDRSQVPADLADLLHAPHFIKHARLEPKHFEDD